MTLKLNRLHPSIPPKLKAIPAKGPVSGRKPPADQDQVQETLEDDGLDGPHTLIKMPSRHVPTCQPEGRWTPAELIILSNIPCDLSSKDKYQYYINCCLKDNIPHRNLKAFQRKLARM